MWYLRIYNCIINLTHWLYLFMVNLVFNLSAVEIYVIGENRAHKLYRMRILVSYMIETMMNVILVPFSNDAARNVIQRRLEVALMNESYSNLKFHQARTKALARAAKAYGIATLIYYDEENETSVTYILTFGIRLCFMTAAYIQMVIAHARFINASKKAAAFHHLLNLLED